MTLDLSKFLKDPTQLPKGNPKQRTTYEAPKVPTDHVICTQCGGTGKRVRKHFPVIPLPLRLEVMHEKFNITPPPLFPTEETITCERCKGVGHFGLADQTRNSTAVMWWTEFRCVCGARFEAPTFDNITIKTDVYRPIIRLNKQVGWRYLETYYNGSPSVVPLTLPVEIKRVIKDIAACKSCLRTKFIIPLPAPEASNASR